MDEDKKALCEKELQKLIKHMNDHPLPLLFNSSLSEAEQILLGELINKNIQEAFASLPYYSIDPKDYNVDLQFTWHWGSNPIPEDSDDITTLR